MFTSLDEAIGLLTSQTNRKIGRYLNSNLEQYDITLEQWVVLVSLSKQDKINQKQLAEKVDKDQPTLARILDILERKKFIERKAIKEDRRAFSIHITDKGKSLKEELAPFIEDMFKRILLGIPKEKIDIYREVLIKINDNIVNEQCKGVK